MVALYQELVQYDWEAASKVMLAMLSRGGREIGARSCECRASCRTFPGINLHLCIQYMGCLSWVDAETLVVLIDRVLSPQTPTEFGI